jgi:RNA recognition motif-containing protein
MVDTLSSRSKEFGFVSFKEPEQADSARRGMDGKLIGSKHITVRLHEPKRLRESRLSVGGTDASNGSVRQGTEEEGVAEKIETGIQRLSVSPHIAFLDSEEALILLSSVSRHPRILLHRHLDRVRSSSALRSSLKNPHFLKYRRLYHRSVVGCSPL